MRAMVCLPTYNERDNLEPMVRALGEQLDASRDRVLVIDDNSPDGTGELADGLAAELPWVEVLHRPAKQGLGPAYIAGFRHAIAAGAELVIEIDCDFSHDPADVPRLIASCEEGVDLTLGSRWVDGGGTVNWGVGRKLVSRGGSLYARTILGVGVRDLTGGFKCFRREVLAAIPLDQVRSNGYAFQIEMSFRAWKRGFRIAEIPIVFHDRTEGESKMSKGIVREAIWMVWRLRWWGITGRA